MRKSAKAKLQTVNGFSLPELLLTILILLLMTQVVADGMPAVIRAYLRAVDAANAETYLNTVMVSLRSKLSFAHEIEAISDTELHYADSESEKCAIINNSDKGILITKEFDIGKGSPRVIIYPALVGAEDFISDYDKIDYAKPFITITNLRVCKVIRGSEEGEQETEPLAKVESYVIHTVNP